MAIEPVSEMIVRVSGCDRTLSRHALHLINQEQAITFDLQ